MNCYWTVSTVIGTSQTLKYTRPVEDTSLTDDKQVTQEPGSNLETELLIPD